MRKNLQTGLLCVFLFSALFTTQLTGADRMEAYGDSLTAGFMTHTNVANAPSLPQVGKLISDLAMYAITKKDRYFMPYHRADLAWPQHLANQFAKNGMPQTVNNFARTGAEVDDLMRQVRLGANNQQATRAFFFIGHNDLCVSGSTAPEVMAENYRKVISTALEHWDRNHTDSEAYLLPVGDIHRVYKTLQGHVWHKGHGANYTCEVSWERLFPFCRPFAKRQKEGTLEDYLVPRIAAYNTVLAELAAEHSVKSIRNRFRYIPDLHPQYEPKFFALDCFHMSAFGQAQFANRIWQLL